MLIAAYLSGLPSGCGPSPSSPLPQHYWMLVSVILMIKEELIVTLELLIVLRDKSSEKVWCNALYCLGFSIPVFSPL